METIEKKYKGRDTDMRIFYKDGLIIEGRILINCDIREIDTEKIDFLLKDLESMRDIIMILR